MQVQKGETQKIVKNISGVVVSNKMDKTIVVVVERTVRHPKYEKILIRSTKLHVHDEENEAKIGDKVLIKPSRPLSKTKSFALVKVVEQAK